MKSPSTIRRALKALRKVVDESPDPYEQRIAYAMETALRWASMQTVGWPSMAADAKSLARLLREDVTAANRRT